MTYAPSMTPGSQTATDERQTLPQERRSKGARPHVSVAPKAQVVSKAYVAAWVMIGSVSASYIAMAALNPDLLASVTGNASQLVADPNGGLSRQTTAQVQALQKVVTVLVSDVTQLKTVSQQQISRQTEVVDRVANIENRLSGISASAPIAPQLPNVIRGQVPATAEVAVPNAAPNAAMKLADQMAEPAAVSVPVDTQAKPQDLKNQARLGSATLIQTVPMVATMPVATTPVAGSPVAPPAARQVTPSETRSSRQALQDPPGGVQLLPSSIETGSVARGTAPPAPPTAAAPVMINVAKTLPPVAKPRGGNATAVQIAAGPSVDALRLNWMLLSDRHSNVLKPLEPRFVSDSSGVYRLVAGPFASPADAQRACSDLKARGASCQTTDFGGEAL
jgi:hypothetical protein